MTDPSNGASQALQQLFTQINDLPEADVPDFLEMTVCAGIELLRATAGDEFVRGFLDSALASLAEPHGVALAEQGVH